MVGAALERLSRMGNQIKKCFKFRMRLLVYRTVTGVPQRVLSVSQRVQGPGGEFHEGDDAVPRQFIEAAYILSESQRPSPFVLSETDLTPEVIAEKAKKYDILPEVRVLPDFDVK